MKLQQLAWNFGKLAILMFSIAKLCDWLDITHPVIKPVLVVVALLTILIYLLLDYKGKEYREVIEILEAGNNDLLEKISLVNKEKEDLTNDLTKLKPLEQKVLEHEQTIKKYFNSSTNAKEVITNLEQTIRELKQSLTNQEQTEIRLQQTVNKLKEREEQIENLNQQIEKLEEQKKSSISNNRRLVKEKALLEKQIGA